MRILVMKNRGSVVKALNYYQAKWVRLPHSGDTGGIKKASGQNCSHASEVTIYTAEPSSTTD